MSRELLLHQWRELLLHQKPMMLPPRRRLNKDGMACGVKHACDCTERFHLQSLVEQCKRFGNFNPCVVFNDANGCVSPAPTPQRLVQSRVRSGMHLSSDGVVVLRLSRSEEDWLKV